MDYEIGKIYEDNTDDEIRKKIGQYYTPIYIVNYIVEKTLSEVNIVENPFISIIDISCGTGFFLISAYNYIKEKFIREIDNLKERYKDKEYVIKKNQRKLRLKGSEYWKEENLHYHILTHCIFGADKDEVAVNLAIKILNDKEPDNHIENLNIVYCDSLIRWEEKDSVDLKIFWSRKYDIVIGNPPYIGHKQLGMEYKKYLLEEYKEVFKDKSDISYCFFKRIEEVLSKSGMAGIISSRYFMENPTGYNLRNFILEKFNIVEIIDFYGASIFKGVGVATAIYFFNSSKLDKNPISINKLANDNYDFSKIHNLRDVLDTDIFEQFKISKDKLEPNRWILISSIKSKIYKKIEDKGKYSLGDLVFSFQGIITGCDRAFVLTNEGMDKHNIEKDLIKRWIKNSNIKKYYLDDNSLSLIYSNLIDKEEDYKNSINYIKNHRDKLENRREYKTGSRDWYELQWGRDISLFERPKIIFPYKARENRFAIDYNNNFFSADIYALILKEEYKETLSLEYILGLLNSKTYEFYFKLFGKKMGKGIYDYYPNSVLDLKIITEDIIELIEENAKNIIKIRKDKNKSNYNLDKVKEYEKNIDNIIQSYFEFTDEEINIINNC